MCEVGARALAFVTMRHLSTFAPSLYLERESVERRKRLYQKYGRLDVTILYICLTIFTVRGDFRGEG